MGLGTDLPAWVAGGRWDLQHSWSVLHPENAWPCNKARGVLVEFLTRHRHEMQGLSVMSGISIAAPSSSQPATEPSAQTGEVSTNNTGGLHLHPRPAPRPTEGPSLPVNREGVTASWDSRTKERQSKRRPRTRRQRAPGSSIVTGCLSVSPVRARVAALGIPRSGVGRGCRRPQAGGRRKASHRRDSELFIPRLSSLPRTRALTIRAVHKQRPLQ